MSKEYVYSYTEIEDNGEIRANAVCTIYTKDDMFYGIAKFNPEDIKFRKPSKFVGLDIATIRAEVQMAKADQRKYKAELKALDKYINTIKNFKGVTENDIKTAYRYRGILNRKLVCTDIFIKNSKLKIEEIIDGVARTKTVGKTDEIQ